MDHKLNCWEYRNCDRVPWAKKISEFGICPASTDSASNGYNGGINAGRICWAVAGSFSGSIVHGTLAKQKPSCITCGFFKKVEQEEGVKNFMLLKPGQGYKPHS